MKRKAGFTLVELLAVIVILSVITLVAGNRVVEMTAKQKVKAQEEMRNNLKEAALEYVMGNIYLEKCSETFSKEIDVNKNLTNVNAASNQKCVRTLKVLTLKNSGSFEDKRGYCNDNDEVIVYHYSVGATQEYRAFVKDTVCTK